jgi:hypothetical protein
LQHVSASTKMRWGSKLGNELTSRLASLVAKCYTNVRSFFVRSSRAFVSGSSIRTR